MYLSTPFKRGKIGVAQDVGGYMSDLDHSFFSIDTIAAARELIGCYLIHEINGTQLVGMIVETEAYLGMSDPASHAYRGKTDRNGPMFGPVGHSYVYISYGIHHCFNVVARAPHAPAGGVLIRALQPIQGIEIMKRNRGIESDITITNGPGKLTQAMGITMQHKGTRLAKESNLYLMRGQQIELSDIISSKRIGISLAQDELLRFYIARNKWVSKQ